MGFFRIAITGIVLGIATLYLLGFTTKSPFYFPFNPVAFSSPLPEILKGPLAINDKLNAAERLFDGKIKWPESFAVYAGKIYTGISDGRILKIDGDHLTAVARTGKKCAGQWEEEICGRPLGMRFDKKGLLYVVDASYGLKTVEVDTGNTQTILPSSTEVKSKNLILLNDLVLDETSNMIYMTQSTTKWNLANFLCILMEPDKSGRLLAYNMKTKEVSELASGLSFANGVEITDDGQKLLVAETGAFRIHQYHLKGPKQGVLEPLLSNLPAEPDNIRRNKKGNFWIGFNDVRTKSTPKLHDRLSEYPFVREVIVRFMRVIGSALSYVSRYVDSPSFKSFAFEVQSGRILVDLIPADGMILEIDKDGKILRCLQSTNGTIGHLSQVLEYENYLYLGSWRNHFIGRIKA